MHGGARREAPRFPNYYFMKKNYIAPNIECGIYPGGMTMYTISDNLGDKLPTGGDAKPIPSTDPTF